MPNSTPPNIIGRGPPAPGSNFAVAGIGASAGGLEACTKFLSAVTAFGNIAYIIVQHLEPRHDSMMVDLLQEHTKMPVHQATEAMPLQPDHIYIIPPGVYLSVQSGALHLTAPEARHGARLPVDHLLISLAAAYGALAIGIILSGTGSDGSLGLRAIKQRGGLALAQAPAQSGFAGMPTAAIATGTIDRVIKAEEMPAIIQNYVQRTLQSIPPGTPPNAPEAPDWLPAMVALLRRNTAHDFTHYKRGTLQRRAERRMAMAASHIDSMPLYLNLLQTDPAELAALASDLLINVTSFFRDPAVFKLLEQKIIPALVNACHPGQPLRIWVAGCSTGEETYSLAILLREHITATHANIKLQIFASDADPDAVATARDGLYPESISANITPQRLARFFIREDNAYRISPDLRANIVFTVQDVLADPPFSRLDLISCRNLLIYLLPEAQARVLSIFHFALHEGGILLLGSAETVGAGNTRFEVIAKNERIYRHIARARPGEIDFPLNTPELARRHPLNTTSSHSLTRPADLAELGRRLVLEAFAPAAVLINHTHQCLFSLGPTERFLQVPKGHSSIDLLAMARPGLRTKLAAGIRRAIAEQTPLVLHGLRMLGDADTGSVSIDIRPVANAGESLLLICFQQAAPQPATAAAPPLLDQPRVTELEQALLAARADLKTVTQDLHASVEEQKAVNQEALSVNEEYQSTNEELLTSKEELQSLNEELTALNSQLQETLERQRKTGDDLQNVLYSTDIATLFLDPKLNIRFFTPATKSLFNIIPSDIGRPLADLHSMLPDADFGPDAQQVLQTSSAREREIEAPGTLCYLRRILPYRTHKDSVAGLVITYTDITDRKAAARALQAAQLSSDLANAAKSRFLAAASHDLRQPLQALALLQALLAKDASTEKQKTLIARMGDTVSTISGMLNTLLDINQIDAGIIQPNRTRFCVNIIFSRLRDEMTVEAQAQGLIFRVFPCSLMIESDQALLEQMIRNLISNAFKYTRKGRVTLGCRRFGPHLRIEVWDTGIGIPERDLKAIFEEYHQLDNAARERSRGLGLGLPIVQRLAHLLGHKIRLRSVLGQGSVFAIEIAWSQAHQQAAPNQLVLAPDRHPPASHRIGTILLIEDDPDIAQLLTLFLRSEGHRVITKKDASAALEYIQHAALQPDLILSDYNLPYDMTGLQLAAEIRAFVHQNLPVIILSGDIATATLREVRQANCQHLSKPVMLPDLAAAIQAALPEIPPYTARLPQHHIAATIFIIDDDASVRETLSAILQQDGRITQIYPSSEAFLENYQAGEVGCLLVDAYLPGISGLDLLRHLRQSGDKLPAILITGHSDVTMAVQAMKAGADDFIEKPLSYHELLAAIDKAIENAQDVAKRTRWQQAAARHIADLTPRQRQIMQMVLAGHPSKNIAADLGISQRTVENHRAAIMRRTGARSLPALARLAITATQP